MGTKTKTAVEPARRLSLWDLEVGWFPLLEARLFAETDPELSDERPVCQCCAGRGDLGAPGETNAVEPCAVCEGSGREKSARERAIEAADLAIAEHSTAEVEKVDSYIGMIQYLEAAIGVRRAEADRNATAARIMEGVLAQVKATAVFVMGEMKRPRLEGSRGYLLAKTNGGLAPLLVSDPELVPDDLCKLEGSINAGDFAQMVEATRRRLMSPDWTPRARLARSPDNTAIRAKLAEPCGPCGGSGTIVVTGAADMSAEALQAGATSEERPCRACGGSKTNAVPGARLGDRGTHLEVK